MLLKGQRGERMANIIYDRKQELVGWASEIIHFNPRGDVVAIGWEEDGRLRAVTLYDGFSECDCNMHIASDGSRTWLKRAFLCTSFAHPFVQWGLRRVTGLVPAKNAAALRFDLHLGFEREGYIRHALPDDDLIILGMLRENCRFIPEMYRK